MFYLFTLSFVHAVEAQVILLKTIDQSRGLTNGARGVIVSFSGHNRYPVVQFINGVRMTIREEKWNVVSGGKVIAMRDQIPLDLAWAMSVHKSQVR
jgi:ATP-dependent DNA helicase PIF1